MTQDLLYLQKIAPGFDQMGGIAVTQAMGTNLFIHMDVVYTGFAGAKTCALLRNHFTDRGLNPTTI